MIEIRFLIFGPKITPGLIFTQNSYIIIPGRFEWPRGKELVCVSYFLSIQWSAAVRPGPSQWASSLEMIIITWTRRNLMQTRLPPPSGHRVIINTSLTRGRLRVSSVVALLTLFPRLCVAMLTPGDTRARLSQWPATPPPQLSGPGPRLHPAIGVTTCAIIASSPHYSYKRVKKIFAKVKEKITILMVPGFRDWNG